MISVDVQDQDLAELQAAATELTLEKVTTRAAPEVRDLVRAEFYAGVDPFDQTWAPLADGSAAHLIDTGSMVGSVEVTGSADGFTYQDDCKLEFHQYGSSRMPAREVLPLDGQIPDTWDRLLGDTVDELLGGGK